MTIPSSVKIAGKIYSIERPEESFLSPDSNGEYQMLNGVHDYINQIIKVAQSGTVSFQYTVFLHEVVHAIIDAYCGFDTQDERFVEQFSKGLYQFLAENKLEVD